MDATGTIRVLLIASGTEPAPDWRRGDTVFQVTVAPDLTAAARHAGADFDAIVLDAAVSADPGSDLHGLIEISPDSAAILLTTAGVEADGPYAAVPAGALPGEQAEVIWLAVQRARLRQDITRSETRFRDVIERNADALVVMDDHGMILFVNSMAVELFGRPRDRLIGSPFGYPAVAGETTELDMHADSHTRIVEMRVVESEWEGSAACIASLRDITHRKQSDENARRLIREQAARSVAETSARRFRFLAESSTVLSASLDYHTTLKELADLCVSSIADWAVVYIVDDLQRVRRLEVAHRDPRAGDLAEALRNSEVPLTEPHPVLNVLRDRSPLMVRNVDEGRLQALSDDPRHVELIRRLGVASFMVVPLTARDRSLGAIALICSDKDGFSEDDFDLAQDLALRAALAVDNARLYRAAQDVNQAKSDLFAAISHDLRTPLNSIIGHADLLSMGIPDTLTEASLRHVERIGTSANHLVHLIDELLTLVRLEAGREELHLADTSVRDLLRDISAVVELLAVERGLEFSIDLPEDDFALHTDPSKLRQVLLNIVGNAIKYTEKGSISLAARQDSGTGVFAVVDTGVGIAPGDLDHMFEPFWQADSARQTTDKGTGLGLSVVQRLVSLLGGLIEAESEPGHGSTFTVTLPVRHPRSDGVGAVALPAVTADHD